jgi:hypothetical protein
VASLGVVQIKARKAESEHSKYIGNVNENIYIEENHNKL